MAVACSDRPQLAASLRGISKRFDVPVGAASTTLKERVISALTGLRATRIRPHGLDVLRGINLEIPSGAVLGLVGRNGSGKSTLLRILAGIYQPDAGTVEVRGRVASLIELGTGFHPEFTGRENVLLNGMLLGLSRREVCGRLDQIARLAGVEGRIDAPVRTYSSGMLARLAFSVAIHSDPDVLLSDEIFAVGDALFIQTCREKMDDLKRCGKTILLVTHDLSTVETWCTHAAWIEGGQLQAYGEPTNVVASYRAFLAQYEAGGADIGVPHSRRWGDGAATIANLILLDDSNRPCTHFSTGQRVTFRIEYETRQPIVDPVFGVAIVRRDGLRCWGTNTHLERHTVEQIDGSGAIEVELEGLDLLPGGYYVDVAIHTRAGRAYDFHSCMHSMWIRSDSMEVGVWRPRHWWRFHTNRAIARPR